MESKFCKSDVNFLNRRKKCKVATYNLGSVYGKVTKAQEKTTHKRSKESALSQHVITRPYSSNFICMTYFSITLSSLSLLLLHYFKSLPPLPQTAFSDRYI